MSGCLSSHLSLLTKGFKPLICAARSVTGISRARRERVASRKVYGRKRTGSIAYALSGILRAPRFFGSSGVACR